MFSEKLADLAGKTDLVILPEMFSTGFTMAPETVAEEENGPAFQWLQQQAVQLNSAICGSVVVRSSEGYHNRFYWVDPDGASQYYDKRHLFRMAGEHEHYQAGQERLIIDYLGWRILPQVCYDLRFPVWSRNQNDYDLAIYVANWPQVRKGKRKA
jgi:predicted amidohydrolase